MSSPARKQAEETISFEILVEKSDLVKELSTAQGVIERKCRTPILSHFLFETSGSKVLITGTDLDVSLRTYCAAHVKKPGSCTIPARKFYDYVRLLPDGDIRIKLLSNDWIEIRSGRSHTKMVGLARANFPNLPRFPEDTIQLPAVVLRTLIQKTIFAVSQEESRYTLNGALLILKPDLVSMVATDGHRLAYIDGRVPQSALKDMRILLPKKALAELYSLLSTNTVESVDFAQDESTLFFRLGSRILTCRQMSGSFPNYEAVMPKDFPHTVEVSNVELSRAIQRVSQFADFQSGAVRLKIQKEELRLSSSSPEAGESEETLETTYNAEPIQIGFNSRYLLDFTRVANTEKVTFHFRTTDLAAELRPAESEKSDYTYRYVVMPMRT